ncbi:DUF535 family protein [Ramlibacter sp. PS4R-6]|uniref:DUF535 family protein n=1 Tax=Ramlibacter sp. PS4R-6 TaxID=3133438 RepID=UPI0030A5EE2A
MWRALRATLHEGKALKRWMAVVVELRSREVVRDVKGEYLRAVRPYVNGNTTFSERVVQLVDHMDWLETAFHPAAFTQVASGDSLVLAELTPPRGHDMMRILLRQAPVNSPEGEMLLTLQLRRSAELQHKPQPIEAAVLAFSRFRIDGTPCLVIGGVRGQRDPVQRVSPVEVSHALQGWKAPVFLVRVAQELARYWNLRLVGLDPTAHRLHDWSYRWSSRYRDAGEKIFASYRALWDHFEARNGPAGWVILPLEADEKLAATALSPEKRARQARRADFWIRTRNGLRAEFRKLLQRPLREPRLDRITQALTPSGNIPLDEFDVPESSSMEDDDFFASRVLETGPGNLDED